MKIGRPIDIKAVKLALKYRKMGLGVREIARLMKKDPAQIMRYFSYVDSKKVMV